MPILSSPLLGLEAALLASPSPKTPIEVMIKQFLIIPIPYSNGLATLVLYSSPIEARNISVSETENPCALPRPQICRSGGTGALRPLVPYLPQNSPTAFISGEEQPSPGGPIKLRLRNVKSTEMANQQVSSRYRLPTLRRVSGSRMTLKSRRRRCRAKYHGHPPHQRSQGRRLGLTAVCARWNPVILNLYCWYLI